MRNPQGHYSFDAYLYKGLQAIAEYYGLSASEYVSRILTPIVKAELMNAEMPLQSIFSHKEMEEFARRELQRTYRKYFAASPFMQETQESFLAFQNFIVAQMGIKVPDDLEVSKPSLGYKSWTPPEKYVSNAVNAFVPQQEIKAPKVTPAFPKEDVTTPIKTQQAFDLPTTEETDKVITSNVEKEVQVQPVIQEPVKLSPTVIAPAPPTSPKVEKKEQSTSRKHKFGSF